MDIESKPILHPLSGPHPANQPTSIEEAAMDFEASFLEIAFSTMMEDAIPAPAGGFGEEMFRSQLTKAFAREVAEAGGVGIARSVAAQLKEYME
ncbi:rod-binding protein [Psychromarinibacter halotolerans]|uniref:Rod-binding protein n=1 Tax=Psychromarinibacter halotolerans TaxID=1775175 RepID=A0ABV7GP24_9RHOB|nr:rod-binding protein [Psychromarinibacter halotolerans]MDF0595788.1 rod-binding protein [Psychromarinibacter halotolerans]